ncbi:hypothetical protein OG21DRAFT_364179 [Imleria badia]|nr:hypothetical protein OG21DRAFT_364179 [Imleria badia]
MCFAILPVSRDMYLSLSDESFSLIKSTSAVHAFTVDMHAALQLSEICDVVCNFLDRRTLARLACTCRAFEEPALDALWKAMRGFEPLTRLLPDSMWILEDRDRDPVVRLLKPLSPQQWKLMQKYASRITLLSSCFASSMAFRKLLAIAVHSRATFEPLPPLFPKLEEIWGVILTPSNVALFYWLKGRRLSRLYLSSFEGDLVSHTLIDFVSDMGTIYPNMKAFSLDSFDNEPPDTMIRGLSKTIRSWERLVDVRLDSLGLDTAAYEHLMRLESLTSLTLRLFHHCLPRLRQAVFPPKPFSMLADLTLDCDRHIPWMIEWLSCLHLSSCLSRLSCSFHNSSYTLDDSPTDPQQIIDICSTIAAQFCHKSLETIILEDYESSTSVQVDSIRPLFSFSRLRYVGIANLCSTSLSDDDLLDLVTSWPLLQVLRLNRYVKPQATVPTFKGFCHLLQHCPRLQELSIVVDTRDSEWVDVVRPAVCNRMMHYLCLGNSFLDDPKRVASILFAILPSVKEINMTCWTDDPLYYLQESKPLLPMWQEVNRHLGELHKCRDGDDGHGKMVLRSTA